MKQPIQPKDVDEDLKEYDEEADPLNTIGEPKQPIEVKGSEEVHLKYNGVEIGLGSSRINVVALSNLAYDLYFSLKEGKPKDEGGSYLG